MSLATRCPHCGTIFRVVQDQLKVSEGWVRCGQCQEIFHGVEALFELPGEPASVAPTPSPPEVAPVPHTPASTFGARVAARMAEPTEREREHEGEHERQHEHEHEHEREQGQGHGHEQEHVGVQAGEAHAELDHLIVDEDSVSETAITWLPDAPDAGGPPEVPHEPASVEEGDELIEIAEFTVEDAESAESGESGESAESIGQAEGASTRALDSTPVPASNVGPIQDADRLLARVDTQTHELSLAQADDLGDSDLGGPQTLAAMLPDAVDDWPPKRRASRKAPLPAIEARQREAAARGDPRFVREARRGERWTRPWVRASLGLALFVLVVAAAAQVAWPLRDIVAARWPETRPALATACEFLECTIEAPRSLASLALDGSSLTRTDVEHVLLFSADLHNRSDHAVRMPSFDLSFTDLNGQVVARKVLAPHEVGIHQGSLGPDVELHVHARLQVTDRDATGFQAEMFYP